MKSNKLNVSSFALSFTGGARNKKYFSRVIGKLESENSNYANHPSGSNGSLYRRGRRARCPRRVVVNLRLTKSRLIYRRMRILPREEIPPGGSLISRGESSAGITDCTVRVCNRAWNRWLITCERREWRKIRIGDKHGWRCQEAKVFIAVVFFFFIIIINFLYILKFFFFTYTLTLRFEL